MDADQGSLAHELPWEDVYGKGLTEEPSLLMAVEGCISMEWAKESKAALAKKMTPDQIAKAEAISRR